MRLERVGSVPISSSIAPAFSPEGDSVVVATREDLVRFALEGGGWREVARLPWSASVLAGARGAFVTRATFAIDAPIVQHDPRTLAKTSTLHPPESPPHPTSYEDIVATALAVDLEAGLVLSADDGGTKEDGVGRTNHCNPPRVVLHHLDGRGVARAFPAKEIVYATTFDARRGRFLVGDDEMYALDRNGNRGASVALSASDIAVTADTVLVRAGKSVWLLDPDTLDARAVVDVAPRPAWWLAASDSGLVAMPEDDAMAIFVIRRAA
jgi:hypothetical protein